MARTTTPNSANSQFFICFDDARFLDKQYTVWGKVIEGMENVDKIKRGEPVRDPDRIVSMKVLPTPLECIASGDALASLEAQCVSGSS